MRAELNSDFNCRKGYENEEECNAPPVAEACEKGSQNALNVRGDGNGMKSNARSANSVKTGK